MNIAVSTQPQHSKIVLNENTYGFDFDIKRKITPLIGGVMAACRMVTGWITKRLPSFNESSFTTTSRVFIDWNEWLDPQNIEKLVNSGIDVNSLDKDGNNAFRFITKNNFPDKMLGTIVLLTADKRADDLFNNSTLFGNTVLISAIKNNRPQATIENILKSGIDADINARDVFGCTPLMLAIERKYHPDIIEILMQAGADINAKDPLGRTPLTMMSTDYNKEPNVKIIEILTYNYPKMTMQEIDSLPKGKFRDELEKYYSSPQTLKLIAGHKITSNITKNPYVTRARAVKESSLPAFIKLLLDKR